MGSRHGSMDEEGEIFESDVEKAPPSLPSVSGPSVDRHSSRIPRRSVSPARSASSRYNDRYDHDRYDRDRQHNGGFSTPRGEKRRRSREDDSRSHRVHYESGNRDPLLRRPRVSYADIDRSDPIEDRPNREFKRSRTRSRTPPRGPRLDHGHRGGRGYDDRRRDGMNGYYDRERRYNRYEDDRRRSRDRSVGARDGRPTANNRPEHGEGYARRKDSTTTSRNVAVPIGDQIRASIHQSEAKKVDEPLVVIEDLVDEAMVIEERRRKREAIKAKYRGQATPLLATALGANSRAQSPAIAGSAPNSPATPQSPSQELTSTGVFTIAKEGGAPDQVNGDEPSAADYDPTVDMREDRKRNEERLLKTDVSSGAYNEMQSTDRDVLMREADAPQPESAPAEKAEAADNDDFDMFAEGDDDDMFAPAVPENKQQPTVAKAVPVVEAKRLDASLLDNWDDHEGYYKMIPGELIDARYQVQTSLGKGMFSGVVRARDTKSGKLTAIKIIRNNESMRKAGMREIEILNKIRSTDPDDKRHVVRLERYFDHKGHLCLVFENLNMNLRDVLKKSGIRDVGISLNAVRAYAHQMFLGLSLLRKCNILHADLKPDNVLVNDSQTILKICDLGSASDASENEITQYLVSRFYRAPEIILGIPYDFALDMWSIGCTLYELYTGKILFTGRTNNQMLRSIMECRGKFSNKILRKGQFTSLHFDEIGNFRSVEKDKITGKDVVRTMTINKPTRELKQRLIAASSGSETELKELNMFLDLLEKCLNLNYEKRCTPDEALKHPFIRRTTSSTATK